MDMEHLDVNEQGFSHIEADSLHKFPSLGTAARLIDF